MFFEPWREKRPLSLQSGGREILGRILSGNGPMGGGMSKSRGKGRFGGVGGGFGKVGGFGGVGIDLVGVVGRGMEETGLGEGAEKLGEGFGVVFVAFEEVSP